MQTIKDLKQGEYFQYKEGGPVWVRGEYCRELKKYSVYKFDDVNHESFKLGSFPVITDFEF